MQVRAGLRRAIVLLLAKVRFEPATHCLLLLGLALQAGAAGRQVPQQAISAPTTAKPGELVDLNNASPAQLRALPGMGDAYVRRIVENRPYSAKNQLVTRGILPQDAYNRIKDAIVAHRLPKKW